MRAFLVTAAVTAAVTATAAASAHAAEIAYGTSGGISVDSDLSACATVSFPKPVTGAGQFSGAGVVAGPGTIVGAVRGARPIVLVNSDSWFGCVPGAYAGATVGQVVYTLTVSTANYDYLAVVHCGVLAGAVTCS